MGDFDDGFLPVGRLEEPESAQEPGQDRKRSNGPSPQECPECDGPLEEDFRCGDYVAFKCQSCGLNIRYFPSEPLATWRDEDDEEETGGALRGGEAG